MGVLSQRLVQALMVALQSVLEAGVANCDVAVVAIGEDMEANIICTMHLKMLGVPCIWAKALTKIHHRILSKLGVDRVIEPEQEIGKHVAQKLHNPLIRDYLSLGNGFYIVDIRVPERHKGHTIKALNLAEEENLRCLGIMRGIEFITCESDGVELESDDKLLLLGGRQDLRVFGERL